MPCHGVLCCALLCGKPVAVLLLTLPAELSPKHGGATAVLFSHRYCFLCRQILNKQMVKEQKATVHFVDDRYETVKAVAAEPSLSPVRVYMADW